jgi:hypothetical protein
MGFTECRTDRKLVRHRVAERLPALAVALSAMVIAWPATAAADQKVGDYSRGALYGSVVDTATGKPLADATVAIVTPDGKVLAWTKTNADGKYAVAADTINVLHLRPSHRRGLLEEICRGIGNVVMAPVKVAVGAVSKPGETVKSAVEASILGNPAPLTAQVTNSLTDKVRATPKNADLSARQAACTELFSERQSAKRAKKPGLCAGELSIAVSAPGYKELKGAAGAYWLEPPVEEKGKTKLGVQAWLETVKMVSAAAPPDKKSEVAEEALLLVDPRAEPALAPAGSKVHLSVRLKNPVGFGPKVRIFARERQKDTVAELTATDPKTPDLYGGDLVLDKDLQDGNTQIAIGVLRMEPLEVKLPKAKEDPLMRFAGRLDDLEAGKPFEFDPRIFACENRMDLTITVLDPKQATPSGSGSAVPMPPGKTAPAPAANVPPPPGTAPAAGTPAPAPAPTAPPASDKAPGAPAPAPGTPPAPAKPAGTPAPTPATPAGGTPPAAPPAPADSKPPAGPPPAAPAPAGGKG